MTNREKLIKILSQWSNEELAKFYCDIMTHCGDCVFFNLCRQNGKMGIKIWLESEADEE